MTDPKKFFLNNLQRVSPKTDPVTYNTNAGLAALAEMLEDLSNRTKKLEFQIKRIQDSVSRLR